MEASPLVVLGLSSALAGALLLTGASHWAYEKRTRLKRVRAATGRRQGRVTSASAKAAKNTHLQQGVLAVMRASTGKLSLLRGRQLGETKRLLVSAGYRGRDAIVVYTFFKLVAPLVFLGGAALYGDQNRLTREEALRLYTAGSAWFSSEDGKKGTLAPGQLADLAVLSADYMSVHEDQIKGLESVLTVLGGRIVHAAAEFKPLAPPLPSRLLPPPTVMKTCLISGYVSKRFSSSAARTCVSAKRRPAGASRST